METNNELTLVVNRWQTPDGTILQSKHTHDFQSHTDSNGETYYIDGGIDYVRMTTNEIPMKDLCLYYPKDDFKEIRKYFMRGTYGKDGNEPFHWIPLCEMTDGHVKACITYNNDRGFGDSVANKLYDQELEYRQQNNIKIEEF